MAKFVEIENEFARERPLKSNTEVQLMLLELIAQFQNDCLQNALRESEEHARLKGSTLSKIKAPDSSQSASTF